MLNDHFLLWKIELKSEQFKLKNAPNMQCKAYSNGYAMKNKFLIWGRFMFRRPHLSLTPLDENVKKPNMASATNRQCKHTLLILYTEKPHRIASHTCYIGCLD